MIKITFCLRRKPGMSLEEFQQYWSENHAPLVQQHAGALHIKRYVQTHASDTPLNGVLRESRGGPEPYDGVAEIWFDSIESMMSAVDSDSGRQASAALLEDEKKFIDLENSPLWLNEERVIIG